MLKSKWKCLGFTLIELIIVIVITSILFAVGIITYNDTAVSNIKLGSQADLFVNDIRYAQNYAMTKNTCVKISIESAAFTRHSYSIEDLGFGCTYKKLGHPIIYPNGRSPRLASEVVFFGDNPFDFVFNGRGGIESCTSPIFITLGLIDKKSNFYGTPKTITINCTGYIDVK